MRLINVIFFSLLFLLSPGQVLAQKLSLEERVAQLEEQLEEVKLNESLNRFSFSGTFINHVESLSKKSHNKMTGVNRNFNGSAFAMQMGLNIDVAISDNLKFFTTLAMGKLWNNDNREGVEQNSYGSMAGSYGYYGSSVRYDVAYLRWLSKNRNWFLSLGRMTTRGGPPMNQLDGLYRTGTYPRLAYNAIFDGAAAGYDFKDFVPTNQSLITRIFYTPFISLDGTDRAAPLTDEATGDRASTRSDQIAILNEWEISDLKLAERLSVYSMLWYYDDFYDSEYQDVNRPGIEYFRATSHTFYLGLEKIAQTGFSASLSQLHVQQEISGEAPDTFDAYLTSLIYQFESGRILGAELIHTGRAYYLDDRAYLHFNDFYIRSRNSGQHIFITIPFKFAQVVRLGLYNYSAKSDPVNFEDNQETVNNYYLSYRIDF
jgi:hypothetical protein